MNWASRYVGLPWLPKGRSADGVDCWGLVHLVYREVLDLPLLSYVMDYTTPEELAQVRRLFEGGQASGDWTQVDEFQPLDVLLFRRGRYPSHVGLYVRQNLMLHVDAHEQSRLVPYNSPRWRPRLIGGYRHITRI